MDAPVEKPTETRRGTQPTAEPDIANHKSKTGSRLSVNITSATQAALERLAEREGVTITEALRRLVGYGDLVYETTQVDGDDLLIRRGDSVERVRLI